MQGSIGYNNSVHNVVIAHTIDMLLSALSIVRVQHGIGSQYWIIYWIIVLVVLPPQPSRSSILSSSILLIAHPPSASTTSHPPSLPFAPEP
jgi:hypothetical protein